MSNKNLINPSWSSKSASKARNKSPKKRGSVRKSEKASLRKQEMLVVSLPGASGSQIKNELQSLAAKDNRSLSNLVTTILKKYLTENTGSEW